MSASASNISSAKRLRLLVIALLFLLPALTAWNMVAAAYAPKLKINIGQRLKGVTVPKEPLDWSIEAFTDGRLQKAATNAVSEAFPARPLLIRLSNSFRKRLFGIYGAPGVVVGDDGELIERNYLDEYCRRDLAVLREKSTEWLPKLKELQDFYSARGSSLIYLTSPSKAAHLPEKFLGHIKCMSPPSDRRDYLPTFEQMALTAGINLVEAAGLTHRLKGRYEVNLFPMGGVHWNQLGVVHAADALLAEINRRAGREIAPRLAWTYEITNRPTGTDTDLADVVNLLFARPRFPVPTLNFIAGKPCSEWPISRMKIALIGGSFVHDVARMLISQGCMQGLYGYSYLYGHVRGGEGYKHAREKSNREDLFSLREAEIVILEENEAGLPGMKHARELRALVLGK
jgi:alginate O-acetyltransferase complex protein AlgJ